eukprot:GHVS01026704.1.p1 GENE.GHVS01026704.1~~GHVS01026704.1.p1  ORF type:complete len:637 (-),score=89.13 GHVS01026704.1:607-2517(-)
MVGVVVNNQPTDNSVVVDLPSLQPMPSSTIPSQPPPAATTSCSSCQTAKYQIVFIASEVGPWSKSGGLGEVMDGLPVALAALGHRVMTIAPRWDQYYDAWDTSIVAELNIGTTTVEYEDDPVVVATHDNNYDSCGSGGDNCVDRCSTGACCLSARSGGGTNTVGGGKTHVRFFHTYKDKVDRLFIDHPIFLEKVWGMTEQKYYGPAWGKDWHDSQVRFSLFSRASLEAIRKVPMGGYPYGENVVVVCNGWHTALTPLYMSLDRNMWTNTKVCLLIHNLVYQGRFAYEPWMCAAFNLPQTLIQEMRCQMSLVGRSSPKVDCVNWLRGSLRYFDKLLTVSPSYANEMLHTAEKGVDLNDDLKSHRGGPVVGILNGIKDCCSPSSDTMRRTANLVCTYNENSIEKKEELKQMFQRRVGLPVRIDVPILMFIGRLDYQKGVDILLAALEHRILDREDVQVVVIGQGRDELVAKVTTLKAQYPTKFASELAFKGPEKFSAYAGSDFVLLCSRYEPCGLVQMEAMRFGVLPIATPTGGLKDTVCHMETGILVDEEIEYDSVVLDTSSEATVIKAILEGIELFRKKPKMRQLQQQAMQAAKDFSWSRAANEYVKVFYEIGAPDVKPLCCTNDDNNCKIAAADK